MISAVINYEDNRVSIHTSKAKKVSDKFQSGFYEVSRDNNGNMIIMETELSELHEPYIDNSTQYIISTVQSFFNSEIKTKVNKLGFIHKLGILLYGIAGTGKSSLMHYIANKMVESKDSIVFFCNSTSTLSTAISLAQMVREIQDNPIIFIADEFERYARENESEMKNFLDGKDSIENTLFLAATNYIDQVPETIKNRPSRFRVVEEIKGITDKNTMIDMLTKMSNRISPSLMTEKEICLEVEKIDSCSVDDLKHIILNQVTKSFVVRESKTQIGFNANKENKVREGLTPNMVKEVGEDIFTYYKPVWDDKKASNI